MRFLILLLPLLAGCAYNSTTITAQGNVTCNASVDKPTNVNPLAGNTVSPSGNTVPVAP